MFLDVRFEWDEVLVDEVSSCLIRVGLGFQPSTCASSRRGREIDKHRLVLSFRLLKRSISVFDPIDEHSSLLQSEIPTCQECINYRAVERRSKVPRAAPCLCEFSVSLW
jgi:hypothetical protein